MKKSKTVSVTIPITGVGLTGGTITITDSFENIGERIKQCYDQIADAALYIAKKEDSFTDLYKSYKQSRRG